MLPFQTIITLNRGCRVPLSQQVAQAIILQIQKGLLPPGTRLPGTRSLSAALEVHRKTVVAAFDELLMQGWIESEPARGTFVSRELPEGRPDPLGGGGSPAAAAQRTGYALHRRPHLQTPVYVGRGELSFTDGTPDERLAPVEALGRNYRSILQRGTSRSLLTYGDTRGNPWLRAELSAYLNQTRGLQTTADNILITRGSQMGIYLSAQVLVQPGDVVVVGETNYWVADASFTQAGARLVRVPVDEHGVVVEAIEEVCRRGPVRAVYVTPHHHHPTTVTLRADRRIRLLQLAEAYRFAVIEDDYDYDFRYQGSPILPLASADTRGMVVYIGSLSKALAPAIRVGYVAAPVELIEELGRLRRIIDRQGDPVLEQAVAELFREGEISRHLKKALKAYHQRRDHCCALLREKLGHVVQFRVPDGGMALWARFDPAVALPAVAEKARRKGLYLSDGRVYDPGQRGLNATRLGFAAMNLSETEKAIEVLSAALG
jgi:GntR family transcriptional regulator/MocR family aminotransferase